MKKIIGEKNIEKIKQGSKSKKKLVKSLKSRVRMFESDIKT